MLVVAFAGFFGWIYEFIFYYFDVGTGEFYMQGGNFLPWINIYAIGAVLFYKLMGRKVEHNDLSVDGGDRTFGICGGLASLYNRKWHEVLGL